MVKPTKRLRELLAHQAPVWAPLVYDSLSARIAEAVGFQALFVSGYAVSVSLLGMPDAGFTTLNEVVTVSHNIANAVSVPVIVDIDTGWGNALNVRRTIREFVQGGVAGVLLEDQVAPKRCGHVAGKQLISLEEAVGKYRAAADVKNELDPDFVVIARTDARTAVGGGMQEALYRAKAYATAGADMVFIEALLAEEEIEAAAQALDGVPLMFNNGVGQTPGLPIERVKELGFALVVSGNLQRAAARAMWGHAQALLDRGVEAEARLREQLGGHPLADFHAFAGFPKLREWEETYLPPEEVQRKYAESVGYLP